jgi:trehalose-phosphatase
VTAAVTSRELADRVQPWLASGLLALDVDGVLAPIVEHADHAELTPGVAASLTHLAGRTTVAILSGRSLESLERLFGFPGDVYVIGSHGLEERGAEPTPLDDDEQFTFDQLEVLGARAATAAGEGAWLEYKPASVVLHTRLADPELAGPAVEAVTRFARVISGAQIKQGRAVVELLARTASKGDALLGLAARLGRAPIVFLGDDVTDEDAFRLMGTGDVSVRVGPGDTAARYRLADTAAVAEFLAALA